MILGVLRIVVIDHLDVIDYVKSNRIHEAKRTLGHASKDHPAPVDIPEIHIPPGPHVERLSFYRPPDAVKAKAKDFLFDGQGNASDRANKLLPSLNRMHS